MRKIFNMVNVLMTVAFVFFILAAGFAGGGNLIAALICMAMFAGFAYWAMHEDGQKRK